MTSANKVFLAMDDTDNETSIGTGRLARNMAAAVKDAGLADCAGVTRHQLLVHPDIPYTSHNSSACLELELKSSIEDLAEFAVDFMVQNFHEGADPGLCIAAMDKCDEELFSFGRLAQKEIVGIELAYSLAKKKGIRLTEHGGKGIGVIGALAAVGLRASGNDGRFIELHGIRDIDGRVTLEMLCEKTGVKKARTETGQYLHDIDTIDLCGWVRPQLIDAVPTLIVERGGEGWKVKKPAHKLKNDNE